MDIITIEKLRAFAPACTRARAEIIGGVLRGEGEAYGVSTLPRLQHFLAQIAHESAGLTRLEESLSYTADRMRVVWPSRFPTKASAEPFERQPYALAERVYGGRMGNTKPGDGWKYRGRGLIMITGRDNYAEAGKVSGLPLDDSPGLAAEPDDAVRIALSFWKSRACNLLADLNDLEGVTKAINGGLVGLEDRAVWLAKARRVFR